MGPGLVIAFALAFVLAALFGALVRPLARRLNFMDQPDLKRKQGRSAVPYGGGPAMLLAFAAGLAILWLARRAAGGGERDAVEQFLPDFNRLPAGELRQFAVIAAAGLGVFVMGLIDDARRLHPLVKLAVQIAAALALFAADVRLTAFIPHKAASLALTVLWVVGITNAFNLLDNMDGLSAGTSSIAAFIFAMAVGSAGEPALGCVLGLLAGAAAGFLVHNFCPARLYMGDAGSYWLGFTLAALTAQATFSRAGDSSPAMLSLGAPLLIMAVPIFDTASVLWIRLREGRPLWVGDRSHLAHRLVGLGLSIRETALAIYLLTLACGLGALFLREMPVRFGALVLAQAAAIVGVVALLEGLGRRKGSAGGR